MNGVPVIVRRRNGSGSVNMSKKKPCTEAHSAKETPYFCCGLRCLNIDDRLDFPRCGLHAVISELQTIELDSPLSSLTLVTVHR